MRILRVLVLVLALVIPVFVSAASAQREVCYPGVLPTPPHPADLGMNLTPWFVQSWWPDSENPDPVGWAAMHHSEVDLNRLDAFGLTRVRIIFNPKYWAEEEGYPAAVYAAVDLYIAANFWVVLTMYPFPTYNVTMQEDPAEVTALATLWTEIAGELKTRSTTLLWLELLNEPLYHGNAAAWYVDQQELHDAIRDAAPYHTIIATGHGWSSAADLVLLTPIVDNNTIYTFHFYDPGAFTYQGEGGRDELYGLPYPPTESNVADALAAMDPTPAPTQEQLAIDYGVSGWDRDYMETNFFLPVYTWANTHGVTVVMNEFGVRKEEAPGESMVTYVADVLYLADKYDFAATWQSYTMPRGLMDGSNVDPDQRTVNQKVALALGMPTWTPTVTPTVSPTPTPTTP